MNRAIAAAAAAIAIVAAGSGCALFQRKLCTPPPGDAAVLLITGGLGHPIEKIARHPWFAVRKAGQTSWTIYQVGGGGYDTEDPFDNSPYLEPILHAVWRGATAETAIECLEREASPWIEALDYRVWPGPNSNTFGDVMLRRCHLHASLPATAIGKDYRGLVGASWTTEGTGAQLETAILGLGLRVGLKEGVEVHVLGLAFGVDLWPPALIVPLGSGRLGIADR